MKPPGTLRSIPTPVETALGTATVLAGAAGILCGLLGAGLLLAREAWAGDASGARLDGLQRAIPGYLVWQSVRFGAQVVLGGLAVAGGVGLWQGWPSARRLAGGYGSAALALYAAAIAFELLWVGPALGDHGASAFSATRFGLLVASAAFVVHALVLLYWLLESEPGPLIWETDAFTPEGARVVLPADRPQPLPPGARPADEPPPAGPWAAARPRRRLPVWLAGATAGAVVLGAAAWAGVALWQRGGLHPHPAGDPATGLAPAAAALPLPAGAVQAFDAHGSVRIVALGYTADGSRLVTVGRDGTVLLWASPGGTLLARQTVREASSGGVVGAAVSPDGRALA